MNIVLNGKALAVESKTLAELLVFLGHAEKEVATAVNSEFVPIAQRVDVELSDGDRVEVIAPMAGG